MLIYNYIYGGIIFMNLIYEILILYVFLFGCINLIRFIMDAIILAFNDAEDDGVNTSTNLFFGLFFIYMFLDFNNFIDFIAIKQFSSFWNKVINIATYVVASFSALSFWFAIDIRIKKGLFYEILFKNFERYYNNTFYYFKLSKYGYAYERVLGDKNTEEIFRNIIEDKKIDFLGNYYALIDDRIINIKFFGEKESLKEYLKNESIRNSYLIKLNDRSSIVDIEETY